MDRTLLLSPRGHIFNIVGVTLHWAASILGLLAWTSVKPPIQALTFFEYEFTLNGAVNIAAFAIVLTIIARQFRKTSAQRALGLLSLAANAVAFVCLLVLLDSQEQGAVALLASIGRDVGSACLILLWGFRFATLDKREAGHVIAVAAPLTVIAYCLAVGFTPLPSLLPVLELAYCASTVCFLVTIVSVPLQKTSISPVTRPHTKMAVFYASRACFGLAIGSFSICVTPVSPHVFAPAALTVAACSAAFLIYIFLHKSAPHHILALLPLLASGCILTPLFDHGLAAVAEAASAVAWFSWILLSSFQLSSLKETFHMSAARLSFSEKAVLLGFWSLGIYVGKLVLGLLDTPDIINTGALPIAAALMYATVIGATYSLMRKTFDHRQSELTNTLSQELTRPEKERQQKHYDNIAKAAKLSPREKEVFIMLAQGHTRPYIKDQLVVSDGTAKSHIAHVYRKLGVHKKEELLQLIKQDEYPLP